MPRKLPYAAAVVLAAGPLTPAPAQPRPPVAPAAQRPTFSPYLGLLYGGASPAFNYFAFVQPQFQAQQQANQLQQQIYQNSQAIQGLGNGGYTLYGIDPNLPTTGHPVVFNNTFQFFGRGVGAGGGAVSGTGARLTGPGGGAGGGFLVPSYAGGTGLPGTAGGLPRPTGAAGFGGGAAGFGGGAVPGRGFTIPGGSGLGVPRPGAGAGGVPQAPQAPQPPRR